MRNLDRNNFENEVFETDLPEVALCSNFRRCTFKAPIKFDKCNLLGCTFEADCTFELSNIISEEELAEQEAEERRMREEFEKHMAEEETEPVDDAEARAAWEAANAANDSNVIDVEPVEVTEENK